MRHPALVATLFALAACSPGPSPAGPTPTGATAPSPSAAAPSAGAIAELHGLLAFVAGEDPQIHVLDLSTGDVRQLSALRPEHAELTGSGPMRPVLTCGFGPSSLTWSPDGASLAFTYGACDGVVYVMADDGEPVRIGDGRGPAWSHDGRWLAYAANVPWAPCGIGCQQPPPEPGAWDLRIVDLAAGWDPVPLTLDGSTSQGSLPVFSPDDEWIAFSGTPAADDGDAATFSATHLVRPDGTDHRHLLDGAWPAGWLPDGRLLVVSEETSELHVIDLASADTTRIGPVQGPAAVSPDGDRILLSAVDPASGATVVRLATIDGEPLAEIAGYAGGWSPDGRAAAVVRSEDAAIVIIGRDGAVQGAFPVDVWGIASSLAWRPGS